MPVNQTFKVSENALVRLSVDRIFWSVMNGLTLTFSTKVVLFSLSDTYFTTK
jgi:long-subunit fatty acid transport protein